MTKESFEELKARADSLRQETAKLHNRPGRSSALGNHSRTQQGRLIWMTQARNDLRNAHKAVQKAEKALDAAQWWQGPDQG